MARMHVREITRLGLLLVSLPPGYPSDGTSIPVFTVEGLRGEAAATVAEGLTQLALARAGEECLFEVVQAAEDIAAAAGISTQAPEPGISPEASGASDADNNDNNNSKNSKNNKNNSNNSISKIAWARASDRGAVLQLSVRTGPKVKVTQIANLSELRRVAQAAAVCVDLAPSRNTENYELASLLASCLQVRTEDVEFVVGGKKEKATGERQALIIGLSLEESTERLLAAKLNRSFSTVLLRVLFGRSTAAHVGATYDALCYVDEDSRKAVYVLLPAGSRAAGDCVLCVLARYDWSALPEDGQTLCAEDIELCSGAATRGALVKGALHASEAKNSRLVDFSRLSEFREA
ncbi:unnamed protein product [Polarella glacialis]|uniref:RWD domain-containing protein n=1 Tax=Polarella glacialis TaxID=89957 RepID=A0A813IQB1_POLGL|nr:unnamed protein product [Polarella glacialis]